jgi:hypothetical protein
VHACTTVLVKFMWASWDWVKRVPPVRGHSLRQTYTVLVSLPLSESAGARDYVYCCSYSVYIPYSGKFSWGPISRFSRVRGYQRKLDPRNKYDCTLYNGNDSTHPRILNREKYTREISTIVQCIIRDYTLSFRWTGNARAALLQSTHFRFCNHRYG